MRHGCPATDRERCSAGGGGVPSGFMGGPGEKISVVIPVRDRGVELDACLASLSRQRRAPGFEVLVVDDGSRVPVVVGPRAAFRTSVLRQVPLGVARARNLGLRHARGEIVVFIDSDCIAAPDFLACIAAGTARHPDDVAFQACLRNEEPTLTASMERLRLAAIQQVTLQSSGHIRYANTSGFALRMSYFGDDRELFDPGAIRGEDTLLLNRLYDEGRMPRYLPDAVVFHCPPLPARRYVMKHFSIGYRAGAVRRQLARRDARTLSARERTGMLGRMWRISTQQRLSRRTLPATLLSYTFELVGRATDRVVGMRRDRTAVLSCRLDRVRAQEIVARITGCASAGRDLTVTYLTAWTLVQAEREQGFRSLLRDFDLVYADGYGVVLALLLTKLQRVKKVTANDFCGDLFREVANRGLRVVLIGGAEGTSTEAARKLRATAPGLDVVGCASGYMSSEEDAAFTNQVKQLRPQLVVVGMGQPLQERWVSEHRSDFPGAVFFCVGGLLDVICGRTSVPPVWVRRFGFEWLYRLGTRPRATWRRYVIGLPVLAFYVVLHAMKAWFPRRSPGGPATHDAPDRSEPRRLRHGESR